MSAPLDAAVGEVLATRVVLVVSMRIRSGRDAEGEGRDAGDLGVDALAHLHRGGADADAAVGVDVDQRRRLVEEGGREGDAEAHRHQGDAPLDEGVVAVEVVDLATGSGDVDSVVRPRRTSAGPGSARPAMP